MAALRSLGELAEEERETDEPWREMPVPDVARAVEEWVLAAARVVMPPVRPVMPAARPSKPKRKQVDLREELTPLVSASDGMSWYVIACDESKEAGEYWIERVTKTGSHITNLSKRFKHRSNAVDAALNEYDVYQQFFDGQEDFE